jgi:hypothetical protein
MWLFNEIAMKNGKESNSFLNEIFYGFPYLCQLDIPWCEISISQLNFKKIIPKYLVWSCI